MTRTVRKPLTLTVIAAFAALVGVAWFGDLASAIPIDVHENGGDEPLLQPAAVAVALVQRALEPYGGLPHDARLTAFAFAQTTAFGPDGRTVRPTVVGFDQTYEPRDARLWKDYIVARVDAATQQTCADGGTLPGRFEPRNRPPLTCSRYLLTFPLHVTWLKREWRPRLIRSMNRWAWRAFAPAVAAPASVTTKCPRPADVGAVRRSIAAIGGADFAMSLVLDRAHTERLWTRAAAQSGSTVARWNPPYPTVRVGEPVGIVAAVVSDGPQHIITVRFATPLARPGRPGPTVLTFSTTDEEPICGPPLRVPEPRLTRPAPAWDSIVAIVRGRAESEIRWRTAGHRAPASSRVVAVDRKRDAVSSIVVETSQPFDGRWRARFAVDERVPEIREAEFTRAGG